MTTIRLILFTFFSIMSKKRTSIQLPMGYAEQVMDLEMKLEEEESL